MVFIDGGYLRPRLNEYFGRDDIDIRLFSGGVLRPLTDFGSLHGEIIRTYYYDAITDALEDSAKHAEQKRYFDRIAMMDGCEVRLGRLVRTQDGFRQKGVDVLLSIDMLGKAHMGHYDVSVLVAGDNDFEDLVRAVKDAGKRVFLAYFEEHVSDRLLSQVDARRKLSKEELERLMLPPLGRSS